MLGEPVLSLLSPVILDRDPGSMVWVCFCPLNQQAVPPRP